MVTADEISKVKDNPKEGLFSQTDDYISLTEVTRNFPSIQEIELEDQSHYESLIEITNKDREMIPIFIKDNSGELHIISSHNKEVKAIGQGFKLVYLGKPFDVEKVAKEEEED